MADSRIGVSTTVNKCILIIVLLIQGDPYLRSFIPAECCVTHDCCFEIPAVDVQDMGQDQYKVLATGEILTVRRSPDGKFYRCACNYDFLTKRYVTDLRARTRCLLAPHQGV